MTNSMSNSMTSKAMTKARNRRGQIKYLDNQVNREKHAERMKLYYQKNKARYRVRARYIYIRRKIEAQLRDIWAKQQESSSSFSIIE